MPTKEELLTQAQSASDTKRAEALYREILGECGMRDQGGLGMLNVRYSVTHK